MIGRLKQSFTLLEVLVSISIIGLSLLVFLALAQYAGNRFSAVGEKMIATQLAQEGVELIRQARDNNWLAGSAWDNGIKGTGNERARSLSYDGAGSYLNPPPADVSACGSACQLYYQNNFFTHQGGQPTKFSRLLLLSKISNDELKIIAQVGWQNKGQWQVIELETRLFNWK